jgi:ABC-type branched-subunit amino acid transport system ATPase component/MFS family permease
VSALVARARAYLDGEAWFPIMVLFALNAVDEFDTRTFDVLGPDIAKSFGVGVGAFGSIVLLILIFAPLIALPVSYVSDRHQRMPLAIASAMVWGAASLATGLAPSLFLLTIFRVVSGFGRRVNEPVHGSLIAEFYSPTMRTKAFGVHALANPIGTSLAALLAGLVAEFWGWRAAFFVLTIPTVIAIAVAFKLKEPERGRFEVIEMPTPPAFRPTLRRLWAIRSLRYQWIGLAFTSGAVIGVGILIPFLLEDEFGLGAGFRGLVLGLGTAVSAVATIIGSRVVQEKINVRPSEGLRLLAWAGVVAGVSVAGMAAAPRIVLEVALIWLILSVIGFVTPGLFSITATVAPPEMRSTAIAMSGLIGLAGTAFGFVGIVIGDASHRWGIAVMAPIFLYGMSYFFKAAGYLDDDIARLDPEVAARARAAGDDKGPVLLETRGLTVSYDGVQVLFGVDIEIRRGEVVALLGTNGAGKSTTLNAISGIVEPDGGNVWFEGEPIVGEAPERTVARGIVQVPGGRGVFGGLSVEENLKMGCFLFRRDRDRVARRIEEVYALFPRLRERRAQKAGSLSGGERQMLTLGTSFLLEPKLILIDELSLGLAPAVVQELLEAVRRMSAAGITVVLVEQSVNIALTLADRTYFMEKGEVRFSGPARELLERRDLLRSVFLEGVGSKG